MNILIVTRKKKIFDIVKKSMAEEGHNFYFSPFPIGVINMIEAGIEDGTPIDIIFSHHPINADIEARIKELMPDIGIITILKRRV